MKTTEHTLKVDLHVHSPASIDYMGNKTVRGYAELVKVFVDEQPAIGLFVQLEWIALTAVLNLYRTGQAK